MSKPKSARQRLVGFGPVGWVALAVALLLGLAAAAWYVGDPGQNQSDAQWAYAKILATVWQVLLAAVMLTWAIRSYRRPDRDHCSACGYPVRGLPGTTCPECGASRAAQDRAMDGVSACGGTVLEVSS